MVDNNKNNRVAIAGSTATPLTGVALAEGVEENGSLLIQVLKHQHQIEHGLCVLSGDWQHYKLDSKRNPVRTT